MSNIAHYRGDRTNYDPRQVFGPDLFGGCYKAIGAEYDAETDRTTIEFTPYLDPSRRNEHR